MEALFVAADGFDARERLYVLKRLREEDVEVDIATDGEAVDSGGEEADADVYLGETRNVYDLVHVSGGNRGRDETQRTGEAVKRNAAEGAFVTAVGEGVGILAAAGEAEDRQVSATGDTAEAVESAGGRAYDEPVIVDGKFVTTRGGDDLPEFGGEVVRKVRRSRVKDL